MTFIICCIENHPPTLCWVIVGPKAEALLISTESSLLLSMLHNFLIYIKSLPLSHCIHVLAGLVLRICLLPKVQIFLLRGWDPERITWNDLEKEKIIKSAALIKESKAENPR